MCVCCISVRLKLIYKNEANFSCLLYWVARLLTLRHEDHARRDQTGRNNVASVDSSRVISFLAQEETTLAEGPRIGSAVVELRNQVLTNHR